MKSWQVLALGICIGLIAAGAIIFISMQPRGTPITLNTPPSPPGNTIHIDGAVNHPGVYTLPRNNRLGDAITAAGGLLDSANKMAINLALPLEDGQKILIPFLVEPTGWPRSSTPTFPSRAQIQPTISGPININKASQQEIETLPGIGETKAAAIITYRQEHGPFKKIDDLLKVPGIGPGILASIQPFIILDPISTLEPTNENLTK